MTTTILGQDYEGRPIMNSIALRVHRLEEAGKLVEAIRYLRAHNMIRKAFGHPCHDLQSDIRQPFPPSGGKLQCDPPAAGMMLDVSKYYVSAPHSKTVA